MNFYETDIIFDFKIQMTVAVGYMHIAVHTKYGNVKARQHDINTFIFLKSLITLVPQQLPGNIGKVEM